MNPPTVPEHVRALRPYSPGKPIEEVRREYGISDVVKLASNENPLGPSPAALDAVRAASADLALYPDGSCYELVRALARHWDVSPENVAVGNGSDELIHYLGLAYLRPGDEVLSGDPSFVRYESAAVLNRAAWIAVPLRDHRFDLEGMLARLNPRTRLVFIANPNNPTGTIVSRSGFARFVERCGPETVVVLDEAYYEYVTDPDYPRALEYVRSGANLVVLRTFSKIYALAGIRVGYALARPEIIAAIHQVREPFNVNSLAQAAAVASLKDPGQVERARGLNAESLDYFRREFARLGLEAIPSCANFAMVDTRRDSRQIFEALVRRGVIVRTGDIFGMPTHIRVTTGLPEENRRFIAALEAALESVPEVAAPGPAAVV